MNIAEIESELKSLVEKPFDPATFPFRLLEIYDAPKATVTKLKQGSTNQAIARGAASKPHDLLWKAKLFFRVSASGQAAVAVDEMVDDPLTKRHSPRLLLATDGVDLYCRDMKLDQRLDIAFPKLNDRFDFFLPLAGMERYEVVAESPADIKATGRLAKLYDELLDHDPSWRIRAHELNLFMTRLLFCFFSERTSIFEHSIFTNTVMSFSNSDGSDTEALLSTLFSAMNTSPEARGALPEYARRFPFVNGGLFAEDTAIPKFNRRSRRLLKECGDLTWQEINPDIFGSMIQAVVEPEMRGDMGMHYTSVPNIMKVLHPLFLLSLEEEFETSRDNEVRLRRLLDRIRNIRVFDPACGSGNFLIISYRELRRIENKAFSRLNEISKQPQLPMTGIKLSHFYGIEIADFAAETARLSLWIAEYQANELFKSLFGKSSPILPLKDSGNIFHGNATRTDWVEFCPRCNNNEIYIVGNPPYLGRADQTAAQKADMVHVFGESGDNFKSLDYVTCWFYKGSKYLKQAGGECAFVTTNSICQGEQVALLWPSLLSHGVEVAFAYQAFKWSNNASKKAAVTCVIVGLRCASKKAKYIYTHGASRVVKNISPYLVEGDNTIVGKRRKPLAFESEMSFGSMANDGGHLILSPDEKSDLVKSYPNSEQFLKRLFGSQEFAKGIERWCLWIDDNDLPTALSIPPIKKRIDEVRSVRLASDRQTTKDLADVPHRFGEVRHKFSEAILVPKNTSERRSYITAGFVGSDCIISDLAFAVYDAKPYILSIISSRLHYIWGAAVGGRFKSDPRYSNTLVYNTFPIPSLSTDQKSVLDDHAWNIISAREACAGKTIGEMYDPDTIPRELAQAHNDLDVTIESMYLGRCFHNDEERLETLFKMYTTFARARSDA